MTLSTDDVKSFRIPDKYYQCDRKKTGQNKYIRYVAITWFYMTNNYKQGEEVCWCRMALRWIVLYSSDI